MEIGVQSNSKLLFYKTFTLVELMIVISIIGILAAISIPAFRNYREKSQGEACRQNLNTLQAAVELHSLEKGAPPIEMKNLPPYIIGGQIPSCPIWNGGGKTYELVNVNEGGIVSYCPIHEFFPTNSGELVLGVPLNGNDPPGPGKGKMNAK